MKIVVTSTGDTKDVPVDPRFGRAAKFILCDTDTGEWEVIDNTQNRDAAQGAGIQAGEAVARLGGVQCVITGHCGPKAFRTLQAAGIQVITGATGTVNEAIEQFKAGDLSPSGWADVEGHWV